MTASDAWAWLLVALIAAFVCREVYLRVRRKPAKPALFVKVMTPEQEDDAFIESVASVRGSWVASTHINRLLSLKRRGLIDITISLTPAGARYYAEHMERINR